MLVFPTSSNYSNARPTKTISTTHQLDQGIAGLGVNIDQNQSYKYTAKTTDEEKTSTKEFPS